VPEAERERPTAHVTADARQEPSPSEWLEVLTHGEVEVEGRLPWSSNYSFLVALRHGGFNVRAVYKPGRGERQLWDFPGGLFRREVAAFLLSSGLGLDLVPETVVRNDAPLGKGSVQRFVDADFEQHYFTLCDEPRYGERLRELAGFDLLLNNADRKGGHVLLDHSGAIWAIDNGLSFHTQPKLRTVMWDFAGEAIPRRVVEAADSVRQVARDRLGPLLTADEIEALCKRASTIRRRPTFPDPSDDYRSYPWPLV
jgi:uncharacterized repeat protein (TIGR03843 family)